MNIDDYKKFLGTQVDVIIDRPIGSIHPKFNHIKFELNYGYVPNSRANDNEEIDVYILF